MKLVRYGEAGQEKAGLIDEDGNLRDLSGHLDDVTPATIPEISKLSDLDVSGLKVISGDTRIGPCVGNVGKMMCIGLNYSDHAAETGATVPDEPLLFMKATSAIIGPNDTVSLPRGSETSDWEVELGVVIGKKAKYVSTEEALDYVAGYCVCNDVSERTFQKKRSGQWTKGKSCDTFGPVGPWLVTRDEVPDPQNLNLLLDVNGERMQTGNTSMMIFKVAELVSYLSQFFTLNPGDIISTGTPPGVGAGIKPEPKFLKPGDVMEVRIEGLGEQRQQVVMDA